MEHYDKHKLDRIVRDSLNAQRQPQDAELWRDIERRLDRRDRRFFLMRKPHIILVLLLIGATAVFSVYRFTGTDTGGSAATQSTTTLPKDVAVSSDGVAAPVNASINQSQPSAESPNAVRSLSGAPNFSASGASNTPSRSNAGVIIREREAERHAAIAHSTPDKTLADASAQETAEGAKNKGAAGAVQRSDDANPIYSGAATDDADEASIDDATALHNADTDDSSETLKVDEPADFNSVASADSFTEETPATTNTGLVDNASQPAPVHPLAQKKLAWHVGVAASLNHVSKKVEAQGWPYDYAGRRQREEKPTTTLSQSLLLGVSYKRIHINTGVGRNTFAEEIAYTNRSARQLVVNSSHYADSSFMLAYDTLVVSEVNNRLDARNGFSRNTYMVVPLSLGYRFGLQEISILPTVGIALARPLRWSSHYISRSGNELENPEDAYGLTPWVTSVTAGVQLSLALNRRWWLDAGGSWQQQIQSVFKTGGPDQRYRSVGGGAGLRYTF